MFQASGVEAPSTGCGGARPAPTPKASTPCSRWPSCETMLHAVVLGTHAPDFGHLLVHLRVKLSVCVNDNQLCRISTRFTKDPNLFQRRRSLSGVAGDSESGPNTRERGGPDQLFVNRR